MSNLYPIYIPSRSRFDNCLTADYLIEHNVDFTLVVEKREFESYQERYPNCSIVSLPGSDYGGVAFARNFIKDLSISRGEFRHWQLDDDIRQIYMFVDRKAIRLHAPDTILYIAERFVDQYQNIAIASLNSNTFARLATKPFSVNSFAYTCFLVLNNTPFRWREGVEDDLDYNLQVLTSGWCTVQFKKLVFQWSTTGSMEGGYTDLYADGKRLQRMEQTLIMWPFIPGIVEKKGGTGYRLNTGSIWRKFTQELIPV